MRKKKMRKKKMRKEIRLTDKLLKSFVEYLHEQEKSNSTIKSYQRELFALQMYIDDNPLTKEKVLEYKSLLTK